MSNRRKLRPVRRDKAALEALLASDQERPVVLDDATQAWLAEQYARRLGHHGMNAYKCPVCGGLTVTLDVHVGVTPAFLACRRTEGCEGMAVSSGYPETEPPEHVRRLVAWSWYRPGERELATMSPAMQHHVAQGGLALRPWLPSDRSAYAT